MPGGKARVPCLRTVVAFVVLHVFAAAYQNTGEHLEDVGSAVAAHAAPLHSIVFVTKRPGGYDVLLEALSRQTNRNYELICVDELADHRGRDVEEMAARLRVNLVAITRSKPKTHPRTRFGIANAINTGFVLAKGHIVTVLQDNIYLPDFFVEKTLAFHADNPFALISYPELRFVAPDNHVDVALLADKSSLSVFAEPVTDGPQMQGWRTANEGTSLEELWDTMNIDMCVCIYLSIHRSIDRSIDLSIYPSIHLSIYLHTYMYVLTHAHTHSHTRMYIHACRHHAARAVGQYEEGYTRSV